MNGACSCGNLRFTFVLSGDSSTYRPRVCDCDFCTSRNIAYVSDAAGSLRFTGIADKVRQGSQSADFLVCPRCGDCVGVTFENRGAFNARLVKEILFGEDLPVSPKSLGAQEKVRRWREIWFPVSK